MAVGPNKLTVSYGTFSCTLEGFDDAFSTMKAVAEYFRDLSAQDRHFGAVPPVPDMEMLERLAENEIRRRVEARIAEGGMVLKAGEEPLRTSAFEAVPHAAQPAPAAPGESVAARLARLRATAARVQTPEEASPKSIFAEDEAAETGAPAALPSGVGGTRAEAAAPAAEPEARATMPEAAPESPARPEEPAAPEPPQAEAEAAPAEPEARARMPEAAQESPARPEKPAAPEASRAEAPVPELEPLEAEAGPQPAKAAEPTAQPEAGTAGATAEMAPAPAPTPAAAGAGWAPPQPGGEAEAEAPAAEPAREAPVAAEEEAAELDDGTDEAIERFIAEPEAEVEAPAARPEAAAAAAPQEPREEPRAEAEKPQGPMLLTRPVVGPAPRGEVENQLRVFMNRLRTAHKAVAEGQPAAPGATAEIAPEATRDTSPEPAPEPAPEAPRAAAPAAAPPTTRGAEPPAASAAASAPDAEPAAPEARRPVEARGRREADDEESLNRDLDRLMETAKSQLEVEDNKRRIDAMSHMKAAVAATEADRRLSPGDEAGRDADQELDRYREDLSRLVQAQRQAAAEAPRRREEAPPGRVVPLVLASEQRVDRALGQGLAAGHGAGVPERMAGATSAYLAEVHDDEEGEEAGGEARRKPSMPFAEFVANLGATGPGELMEAAAAYLAVQEGREFFSRPQIMRKLALVVGEDDFTREDGLRAFGALLREGRIAKLRRGQFTISKTSRFIDKARGLTH